VSSSRRYVIKYPKIGVYVRELTVSRLETTQCLEKARKFLSRKAAQRTLQETMGSAGAAGVEIVPVRLVPTWAEGES
jgi:hypothetical protein